MRKKLAIIVEAGSILTEVIHEYPDITIKLTLLNAKITEVVPPWK